MLEAEGYHTILAANGLEALERLQREPETQPDLILLDMMMPVMDGWQFAVQLRSTPALGAIPVVAVSADGHVRGQAATIGANGHREKPVKIVALLEAVERPCGRPDE